MISSRRYSETFVQVIARANCKLYEEITLGSDVNQFAEKPVQILKQVSLITDKQATQSKFNPLGLKMCYAKDVDISTVDSSRDMV